ncbi:BLOC-1 subunit 2 family protein [Cohnella zeiphila]|uniref:Chromosome partition protein Smc n=1 Tax=Cohnella zeiphila TaxID=2761120 RepID=A0A7X0VW58_9BACL|nr:BLOC-1 subunit 2 family protein [Cohnella zeiphila]MBB6732834.1 hypothetical protein [Cohnella zeiphila]
MSDMDEIALSIKSMQAEQSRHGELLAQLLKMMAATNQKVTDMDRKVDRLDQRVDRLEQKVDKLDQRVDRLEQKVDKLEQKVDKLEQKVDKLEQRTGALETRADEFDRKWEETNSLLKRLADGQERQERILDVLSARSIDHESQLQRLRRTP